jgi:hypothetical protein
LSETTVNQESSGTYEGVMAPDHSAKGTFADAAGNKETFEWHQNTAIPKVVFSDYYHQNCEQAKANMDKNRDEMSYYDTICSYVSLSVPRIQLSNAAVSQRINQAVDYIICNSSGNSYNTIIDLLQSVDNLSEGEGYSLEVSAGVITNEKNIYCIGISNIFYGYGAAHPNSSAEYYNYDIATGKLITLENLIQGSKRALLNRLGEKIFEQQNGAEGWFYESGKFSLPNDFAILKDGLMFAFDPYEIGPYAAGAPEVFISYKELKNYLFPHSAIDSFLYGK